MCSGQPACVRGAARQQIKETGERGLILADVGIALGAFFTVALACYFLAIVLVGASAGG